MGKRFTPILLLAALVAVHAQLWLGVGSMSQVQGMRDKIKAQNQANEAARQANAQLDSEVHDLKGGLEMVEEKARSELGMVKSNEIYVQVVPK